ncbi:cell division protein ZipA [Idiomarina fontislapidosi]|uniref:Cell division protein ZipA n=1 Tax=Idiomarina fontislapidosi TaxID=263723 RepID=A0A432XRV9_9GAMM|nr:cell division protein ZipA [Idiomarina fontislapidosi]PYE31190.1 cell division protein ZipA [Idiomarina fontislapidosi]RUO51414.1 cell division protein ZipA [Idiomarina fontislapidosi]
MSNLQITLSIIGVLLIAGIIAHGLWTMRRNNSIYKQAQSEVAEKRHQQQSSDDFDADGIGAVKTIKATRDEPKTTPTQAAQMSMDLDLESDDEQTPLPSMRVDTHDEPAPAAASPVTEDSAQELDEEAPESVEAPTSEPVNAEAAAEEDETKPQPPQDVISLFVKGNVQGALLLQMMTELGCKFGEMGIFHRYEHTNGTGTLIFSVANMFNPGTFDLDNIEQFETDGVALFMTLPINYDGQQAFNMMLNAAKKLATEIPQGQVLDGSRQLLTRQSIQQAHQKVRQYETKH